EAVRDLLDFLPPTVIRSVVVFTGDAVFKTPIPPGVFYASEVVAYLRNMTEEAMSHNRVQFCVVVSRQHGWRSAVKRTSSTLGTSSVGAVQRSSSDFTKDASPSAPPNGTVKLSGVRGRLCRAWTRFV